MKVVAVFAVVVIGVAFAAECERACTKEVKPVCAVFRKEYSNECEMNADACRLFEQGMKLEHTHEGVCPGCRPFCITLHRPVCGSDGVTYDNRCKLHVASCTSDKWIEVASEGECNSSTEAPEEDDD